jgi:hypothetical protein
VITVTRVQTQEFTADDLKTARFDDETVDDVDDELIAFQLSLAAEGSWTTISTEVEQT